jgi:hypothetical protein
MDGGDSTLPILAPIAITSLEPSHCNLIPSSCNQAANVLSGRKDTPAIGQLLKKLHPEAGRTFPHMSQEAVKGISRPDMR